MAILAIDQGGSKTAALVSDKDGNILGIGTGFGACHFSAGVEKAMSAVEIATREALSQARMELKDITLISAGLAGANWPDEIEMLEKELLRRFGVQDVSVCNDCVIALSGGTDNPNAVVICGGTGLNCAVSTDTGTLRVYNNYVEDLDQGGGSLGARALLAVFQSEIGIQPPTMMTKMALDFFELDSVDALLLAYQRNQLKKPLKEVAFLLFEAAEQYDQVALDVIYAFGESLSRYVIAGARMYGLIGKPFDVVLSGGIFKAKLPLLMDVISALVHRVAPSASVINAQYEPVIGAAIMGLSRAHGGRLEKTVRDNCHRSAERFGLMRNTEDSRSSFFL
jgi:N-acetylglucosamine kinase-like BadF-type ATPase